MATIEHPPVERASIARSRSARLADQAAIAALYVTHPERRLSVRDPRATGTDLSTLKATGSRPGFSHASAVAALAHAKSRQPEPGGQSTTAVYVHDYPAETPSQDGHRAAICAVRDRSSIISSPSASSDIRHDISTTDQTSDARRELTSREKAIRAATGALYNSRRRSDSAPVQGPNTISATGGALEGLDKSMEASRIQHLTNTNSRLYTATPPVAIEQEEQNKKNMMQAAAISMAREMYNVAENQASGNSKDAGILRRPLTLQEVAQKRAAEKIASMQDETAIYREYYGIEQQPTRSSMPARKRRTSVDSDTSNFDAERSKEIRSQMTNLRSKLDAVDEQRQKDRAMLMEAARKNVDATIQDMEIRLYGEAGRYPPSARKELTEVALARARQDIQDIDSQGIQADRVNLGAQKYIDMSDVEAIARSRLQPTFDEIHERAETQRAKELEQRLDEEERLRHANVERQREADTRAEEKRQRAAMKQEARGKEEKNWAWKKKAKRNSRDNEPSTTNQDTAAIGTAVNTTAGTAEDRGETTAEASPEAPLQDTVQTDSATQINPAIATGAGTETAVPEPVQRSESKLKTWFSRLGGRRSSGAADEPPREVEAEPETTVQAERAPSATGAAEPPAEDGSRATALTSHPVTANDLVVMQRNSIDGNNPEGTGAGGEQAAQQSSETNPNRRSRLKSRLSNMVSRGSQEDKIDDDETPAHDNNEAWESSVPIEHIAADELPSSSSDRDELRESATDQGLPIPPAIGKRISNGTTGRESRFSEDL